MKICIYVAKDTYGTHFFKDMPDLLRVSSYDPLQWTGYGFDFGDFSAFKSVLLENRVVKGLDTYEQPLKIVFTEDSFVVEQCDE